MPAGILSKISEMQLNFVWKGKKNRTIREDILYQPKDLGGMVLVDFAARAKAIQMMRLKSWLATDEPPRWTAFAASILARETTTQQLAPMPASLRLNPFLQTWKPPQQGVNAAHIPSDLKDLMNTAIKTGTTLQCLQPSKELRERMILWFHRGLYPESREQRNQMWRDMQDETAMCLLNTHGVLTMGQLKYYVGTRMLNPEQIQHENTESCDCDACTNDMNCGCETPARCYNRAQQLLNLSKDTRWDPTYDDAVVPDDAPPPSNKQNRSDTIKSIYGSGNSTGVRARSRKGPARKIGAARAEAIHNMIAEQILSKEIRTIEEEEMRDTVILGAQSRQTSAEKIERVGAIVFPNRLDDDEQFKLEFDDEAGPQMTHPENDPILPLIIGAIKAIHATPPDVSLNLVTNNKTFKTALTSRKEHHEITDFVDLKSACAWRTLFALILRHEALIEITLSSERVNKLGYQLTVAFDEDPSNFDDLIHDEDLEPWRIRGVDVARGTQKLFYKNIRREETPQPRRPTMTNMSKARHAAFEHNGAPVTEQAVWKSMRSKALPTNDHEFQFKTMHDAYVVGSFWERVDPAKYPDQYERRNCGLCKDPPYESTETMEHILTECEASGQDIAWSCAKTLWQETGNDWPKTDPYGTVLAAGVLTFDTSPTKKRKAHARLFAIICAATCRAI